MSFGLAPVVSSICWSMRSVLTAGMPQIIASTARRSIARRAVEAMIWGMPAVNTDLMLQQMLDTTGAKPNDMIFWSRPANWKNQTLTPNPDSIYFMSFWNVKDGPVVI